MNYNFTVIFFFKKRQTYSKNLVHLEQLGAVTHPD